MRRLATAVLVLALLLGACTQRPAAVRRPPSPTATPTQSPSPTTSVPFAPTADCEDATAGDPTFPLSLQDNLFVPACVVLLGGQSLRLVNDGANLHNFRIEGTQVDIDVPPGQEETTPVLAEAVTPGTYRIFCRYHAHLGMEGDITITAVG